MDKFEEILRVIDQELRTRNFLIDCQKSQIEKLEKENEELKAELNKFSTKE